ncbi:pectin lyase-like superfamily protein [Striga asiatica]|uniref:Pectin lyase-like superfamily protein n=1 Tax=Striga asiatica TaxID=4170 RepID=A0A5A7QRK5_STRAF|nr:pectin lyase-like superfamily protein [Striga asiatica]
MAAETRATRQRAFRKTWYKACKVNGGVILVPAGYTFLLQTVTFDGSNCKPNTGFQIDGTIVAPDISKWPKSDFQWILFINSRKGLIVKGNGIIDGRGAPWWNTSLFRPHALRIANSSNVVVAGITIQNPPQMHLFIDNGQYIQVYNFKTSAPAESPNTDGIHLSNSQHAVIHNNTLACVYNVNCGPGHGYSIGGLGPNFSEAQVSDVSIFDSKVQNSLTGVRIKTWPGGSGSVTNIRFSNIQMSNVRTSIVIDQFYCGGQKTCTIMSRSAVQISNVTFEKLTGSYTDKPVSLLCSPYKPCRSLKASIINLVPSNPGLGPAQAECSNTRGQVLTPTTPPLNNCLMGPPEGLFGRS